MQFSIQQKVNKKHIDKKKKTIYFIYKMKNKSIIIFILKKKVLN